jgi:hypothetical protein
MTDKLKEALGKLYATESASADIQESIRLIIEYLQERKESMDWALEPLEQELNTEIDPAITPCDYERRFQSTRFLAKILVKALKNPKLTPNNN